MLPEGHKSAEPTKAGREGTSDPEPVRPASPPWRGKPNRWPKPRHRGSPPTRKWVGQPKGLWSAGARLKGARQGRRGHSPSAAGKACEARRPESTRGRVGSYSGRRVMVELGNPSALPSLRGRMAEATGERAKRGRSLRSSPRAGKPSTRRRQAVDTICKQEMDVCPTR